MLSEQPTNIIPTFNLSMCFILSKCGAVGQPPSLGGGVPGAYVVFDMPAICSSSYIKGAGVWCRAEDRTCLQKPFAQFQAIDNGLFSNSVAQGGFCEIGGVRSISNIGVFVNATQLASMGLFAVSVEIPLSRGHPAPHRLVPLSGAIIGPRYQEVAAYSMIQTRRASSARFATSRSGCVAWRGVWSVKSSLCL